MYFTILKHASYLDNSPSFFTNSRFLPTVYIFLNIPLEVSLYTGDEI